MICHTAPIRDWCCPIAGELEFVPGFRSLRKALACIAPDVPVYSLGA